MMKTAVVLVLATMAWPAAAQQVIPPAFTLTCAGQAAPTALQQLYCETRELTLPAPPAGTAFTVDARPTGSISVRGWAGAAVRVRARVEGRAATAAAAKALAASVRISSQNHALRAARANGVSPDGWSVSYEVLVPARTNLLVQAVNGSISLEGVEGKLQAETTNGSLTLTGLGGDVRARTANGSLTLRLTGPEWQGSGLVASTTNGNVTWQVPATYAATLVARTTRGRVQAQLSTARKKVLPQSLVATLGKGGPQLQATTVNGSVTVQQEPVPAEPASQE